MDCACEPGLFDYYNICGKGDVRRDSMIDYGWFGVLLAVGSV